MDNFEKETEIEFLRSSGPGGQNVNKRDTAVRLRHIPTGITVKVQSERSQAQNLRIAFKRLEKKLEELNRPKKPRIATRVPKRQKEERLFEKHERSEAIKLRKISTNKNGA